MRRNKAKSSNDFTDELDAPLLAGVEATGDVSDVVFGRDKGYSTRKKREEMVEMKEMKSFSAHASIGGQRRRHTDKGPDEPTAFVWHMLESHHTLAGVALQYRCTTEQLMRFNNLGNEMDIYTRDKIKIPATEHGVLMSDPSSFTSAEAGTALHTVALPVAQGDLPETPRSADDGAFPLIDANGNPKQDTPGTSAQAFLRGFDIQMESAITKMDDTITRTLTDGDDAIHIRMSREENAWEVNLKDWRVTAVAVAAVFLVSFSTYFLYHMVKPDNGEIPHGSQHYKTHPTGNGHS